MTNTTCDINKSNIDYYRNLLIGKHVFWKDFYNMAGITKR